MARNFFSEAIIIFLRLGCLLILMAKFGKN